jgi:CBS domain-containing protein
LVKEIMAQPVTVAKQTNTLETAARLMVDHDIGCLPIVDDGGKLVGILTEGDFQAHHGFAPFSLFEMPRLFGRMIDVEGMDRIYADAKDTPIAQVMQRRPVTLHEEAPLEEAARLMVGHGFHHVPIVRDGRPVGMVARRDLLRLMTRG